MEEDEYKSTYNELTSVRCVFEKALTHNQAKCRLSRHFWLADREGYACRDAAASDTCGKLLELLRSKSAFVLKRYNSDEPLPHNMELRVQVGGVSGLANLLAGESDVLSQAEHKTTAVVSDINGVVEQSLRQYGSLEALPYSKIIQSVEQFQGRRRRQR